MKRRYQFKWFLLLVFALVAVVCTMHFREDRLTLAKKGLKDKGYSVRQAYRSNPVDQSIIDAKAFLKREELSISQTERYQEKETLEVTSELNTLAPYVEKLNCGLTKTRDQDAAVIGKMHRLRTLCIYGPELTDQGVAAFSKLKNLEWLELYAPQATDEGLNWLQQNDQLSWLFLIDSQVGTQTLQRISSHRKLIRLCLQGTRVESADLQYLTRLPQLYMLELNGTFIDDQAAPFLSQMTSVNTLYLSETEVGDQVCQALTNLPELDNLLLDDTLVTDQGVQALLSGCPELKRLSLRRCDVSAQVFLQAKIWPANLEQLSVTGTRITDREALEIILKHPSLQSVGYNYRQADPEIIKLIDKQLKKRRDKS